MSIFHYFISCKQLPNSIIERAHSIHYSIDDVTKYVKDAKVNHFYYNCDPFAIYITNTEFDIDKILSFRESQESNFILWLAKEFSKLGVYRFIRMREDNTRCSTGYFELFFQKCRQGYLSNKDFCMYLENDEKGIETDVVYTISEKVQS